MKKYLITGLLIWIPLVITAWVLKLIVDALDQVLPLLPREFATEIWLGMHVPGMGHCTSSAFLKAWPLEENSVSEICLTLE